MSKQLLFSLLLLVSSFSLIAQNDYYWVGGSGYYDDVAHWASTSGGTDYRSVEPGPTDNVFFDANSGFAEGNKVVTLRSSGFSRNITFSDTVVPIEFVQEGDNQSLHIYGSSVWQEGMTLAIHGIYYENTNEDKTIRSNGVWTGAQESTVYFIERGSISLLDDFNASQLEHQAGVWNTNGHLVNLGTEGTWSGSFMATGSSVVNLFGSEIYLNGLRPAFNTSSSEVIINPGTSHIHFSEFNHYGGYFIPYAGQSFYNLSFEGPNSTENYQISGSYMWSQDNPVTYNTVEFYSNGIIEGFNVFNSLKLVGGGNFQIEAGKIQVINNEFRMHTSECSGWKFLKSTSEGSAAMIAANSGVNIDVKGGVLKDIHTLGDTEFIARNSVDQGNNIGWEFIPSIGLDLFWVGGAQTSNWNDVQNWSTTSGGDPGGCIPGPNDNVFFDRNSGFTESNNTVTLLDTGFARDIIFDGTAVPVNFIEDGTQSFHIYGSSQWQEGMTIEIEKIYYEDNNDVKTIRSNGVYTGKRGQNSYVYFMEQNTISLLDDFHADRLVQTKGVWNTNGYTINLGTEGTWTGSYEAKATSTLNLSNSHIFLRGLSPSFDTSSANVTLNSGTSHIHFANGNLYGGTLYSYPGQILYDISFEEPNTTQPYSLTSWHEQNIESPIQFNKVEFHGNGKIEGYNIFNILVFYNERSFWFESNKTQLVLNELEINSQECSGWNLISSTHDGIAATISASSNTIINVRNSIIKDIQVEGGAEFIAENSLDQGNNTGWTFTSTNGIDLYWVGEGNDEFWNNAENWSLTSGGIGGVCVPGPNDNVFFDNNSGFSETSNNVIIRATTFVNDIIFTGTLVPVHLLEQNMQSLHIYGSSEWQEDMQVSISHIYYENGNELKTIKSNGVRVSSIEDYSTVYFRPQTTIDLLDAFAADYLKQEGGIWNTNGHTVILGRDGSWTGSYQALGSSVVNLFDSEFYLHGLDPGFDVGSPNVLINPGSSIISFRGSSIGGYVTPYPGQVFNHVIFENHEGRNGYRINGWYSQGGDIPTYFSNVEFFGDGRIEGFNEFGTLILHGAKDYHFEARKKQIIDDLQIRGTPCDVVKLRSTQQGQQADIEVTGEQLAFNFVNIRDIKAIGEELFFDEQSTDAGNNTNIYFEPYFPGSYNTYLGEWECYIIDENNPMSFTLSTERFYGYENTDYEWYKKDPITGLYGGVISTEKNISIHPDDFGPGTYKVTVTYHERPDNACLVFGEVTVPVPPNVPLPVVNANVCEDVSGNTLADVLVEGDNIRWYSQVDSEDPLPLSTEIQNNETYYVTQQPNICESARKEVLITIIDCSVNGELSLIKTIANREFDFSEVGDVVEYTITISNIGELPIFNIEITDDNADESAVGSVAELAIGESQSFTAAHTVSQEDVYAGYVSNLALAEGVNQYDYTISVASEDNNPIPNIPSDPDCPSCTIAPVRQGPTARDDSAETYSGLEISIAVLDNDEEGNSPIIPESVRLIDLDDHEEVVELIVSGEGTFLVQGDGSIDFQSEANFSGAVTPVNYIIYDENSLSDQATIYITVIGLDQPIVEFNYSQESFCQLDETPRPILSEGFTAGGVFSATPYGLSLDPNSGAVDLEASEVGIYNIIYTIEEDLEGGIAGAQHAIQLEIIGASQPIVDFNYGESSFCILEGELTPQLDGAFTQGGVFSSSSNHLIIDATTGVIDLGGSASGQYEITYTIAEDLDECRVAGEATVEIEIWDVMVPLLDFNYSAEYYCMGGENPIPNFVEDPIEGGVFTSFPNGLIIDSSTGIIDLSLSEAGYYEVTYSIEEDLQNCFLAGENTVMVGIETSTTPIVQFQFEKEIYCPGNEKLLPIKMEGFTEGGVFEASPVGLAIDSSTGEIDLNASDAGDYEISYIIVEDRDLCLLSGSSTVNFRVLDNIAFDLVTYCDNKKFKARPQFTDYPPSGVEYMWKDEAGAILGGEEVLDIEEIMGSRQLPFQITLLIKSGECEWSESIVINKTYCNIPEGFSPNGDGINDSVDLEFMDVRKFQVYNRYGKEVYSRMNYINEWEGQSNSGNNLPTGSYYYTIETKSGQVITGSIYLNR